MLDQYLEYNFDGLVGPTHNYSGLAVGNIASSKNVHSESKPKSAALQGLAKMRRLYDLGIPQAVLPPQPRPDLRFLRNLGFTGSNEKILNDALKQAPRLFAAAYSASSMWTANAATVSPSLDTSDGLLHLTPANLAYNIHRTIEADTTYHILKTIFNNDKYFKVHRYLPHAHELGDEGAANHTRFYQSNSAPGIALFVYGQEYYNKERIRPHIFPARQTLEASQSVARQHGLDVNQTVFLQQNPAAIDAGVFHNDVCAVGNQNILLCHDLAYVNQQQQLKILEDICTNNNINLNIITVSHQDLPIEDMVKTYLFNSQLVTISKPGNGTEMILITPQECAENSKAVSVLENIINSNNNPINQVEFIDCRQSMRNGGGPACLRLRILMSQKQVSALNGNVILNEQLFNALETWINKHYRDVLTFSDLLDPKLVEESYQALDELSGLLSLGSIYYFQQ